MAKAKKSGRYDTKPPQQEEEKGVATPKQSPLESATLATDLIPKGWEVVEDVAPTDFQVGDLEFISFLEGNETSVGSETMRSRAVVLKANLGLADGKRILAEQEKIPVELRGCIIVLPGTVLRSPDGCLRVADLYWNGNRWCLFHHWIVSDWGGRDRLARNK